jgi:hypothetical protein
VSCAIWCAVACCLCWTVRERFSCLPHGAVRETGQKDATARTVSARHRPVHGPLSELGGLEFQQVRRTPQEPLFNSLLEQYHYLRY